jgi:hypothetical protein
MSASYWLSGCAVLSLDWSVVRMQGGRLRPGWNSHAPAWIPMRQTYTSIYRPNASRRSACLAQQAMDRNRDWAAAMDRVRDWAVATAQQEPGGHLGPRPGRASLTISLTRARQVARQKPLILEPPRPAGCSRTTNLLIFATNHMPRGSTSHHRQQKRHGRILQSPSAPGAPT